MSTDDAETQADEVEKWDRHDGVKEFSALYVLDTEIAKGSFGTVWTASPISDTNIKYAVKIIDRSRVKEKDIQSVFREVEIMKELRGVPNIITIIDFLDESQYLYVVQSYARGGDLFSRLTRRRQYTENCAREIALVLFKTLDDMHSKYRIAHRDLKPENLLLEDSNSEKLYFGDFGFARHVGEEGLKTRCGTPAFVAPEIVVGRRYNEAVDMWSIGVILFMLLGGYSPFTEGAEDLRTLFHRIRGGDFMFRQSQWVNVSPEAKCLIARLLTVDPDYRYTAKQALNSDWVKKMDTKSLRLNNLHGSLCVLKKSNTKLSLKGAMHAVRFAVSSNFWAPEKTTFSKWSANIDMNNIAVNAALHCPAKSNFHDEYELLSQLRNGSSATLHECRHKKTGDMFVVKIVHRAKLRNNEDEYLLNEVSIMQSLSAHEKYVVQALDFFEEEEFFFLVREYMNGGNVFHQLSKKTKYTEEDAKELTRSLLRAVKYMHDAGIAHRDLKPQNLLLRFDGNACHVKVAEFSFASRIHAPNCLTSRCGSPSFVAPEILKNIPHDHRVDLWSVGVIIYLLLVGYPPFAQETQSELFTQIRTCDWKFYAEDWENISPDARDLIENLLVADPEQRWTAAQSMECVWLQTKTIKEEEVDLTASLSCLRKRRASFKRHSLPVQWPRGEILPVDLSFQCHSASEM